jgi:hypothetical protein
VLSIASWGAIVLFVVAIVAIMLTSAALYVAEWMDKSPTYNKLDSFFRFGRPSNSSGDNK